MKSKALYHCVPIRELSLDMHFEAIEAILRELQLFTFLHFNDCIKLLKLLADQSQCKNGRSPLHGPNLFFSSYMSSHALELFHELFSCTNAPFILY